MFELFFLFNGDYFMNHNKYWYTALGLFVIWGLTFILTQWFKSYKFEQLTLLIILILGGWLVYWTIKTLYYLYTNRKSVKVTNDELINETDVINDTVNVNQSINQSINN